MTRAASSTSTEAPSGRAITPTAAGHDARTRRTPAPSARAVGDLRLVVKAAVRADEDAEPDDLEDRVDPPGRVESSTARPLRAQAVQPPGILEAERGGNRAGRGEPPITEGDLTADEDQTIRTTAGRYAATGFGASGRTRPSSAMRCDGVMGSSIEVIRGVGEANGPASPPGRLKTNLSQPPAPCRACPPNRELRIDSRKNHDLEDT